jgi:uncharacterized repeat protein (TIGR03803 family)
MPAPIVRLTALCATLLVVVTLTALPGAARLRPANLRWTTSTATAQVVYAFKGVPDGATSTAGLIADTSGALYGTTTNGGAETSLCPGFEACGTVFKLTPTKTGYTESILHRFRNGSDGADPVAGLTADSAGALYGTTALGGGKNAGTVFKLTPAHGAYTESVVYRFRGGTDGAGPNGTLIADRNGALYGTAPGGGSTQFCDAGCGTVFKLTPTRTGYVESTLYSFCKATNCPDGAEPFGGLIEDRSGALYGTTYLGGGSGAHLCCGTVFKLTPTAGGYVERVLYRFCREANCTDGAYPLAGLIADGGGALYGTTEDGGSAYFGAVFKLTPDAAGYRESVLYSFAGLSDGAYPAAGVTASANGSLFGTTASGGGMGCDEGLGCGTVFELVRSSSGYHETVVYTFTHPGDGATPEAGVLLDTAGAIYGTASQAGISTGTACAPLSGCGVVFKLK